MNPQEKRLKKIERRKARWMQRYNRRRQNWHLKALRPRYSTCPSCGGSMRWCSICEMWSKSCCNDWGTCLCS